MAAYLGTFSVTSCPPDEVQGRCLRCALRFTTCLLLTALVPEGPQCELTELHPGRRSVIEISRALKELFHEARERASKALGFAKMLRKVSLPPERRYPPPRFCRKADAKEVSVL